MPANTRRALESATWVTGTLTVFVGILLTTWSTSDPFSDALSGDLRRAGGNGAGQTVLDDDPLGCNYGVCINVGGMSYKCMDMGRAPRQAMNGEEGRTFEKDQFVFCSPEHSWMGNNCQGTASSTMNPCPLNRYTYVDP
ncbi:MAG: hypothetical protein AB7I30_00585 [Isosphaeraceae bacterium]